jgi:UDP-N-acetylmuramate dehydrogenase
MHLIHDAQLRPFNAFGVPARARALARVKHWHEVEQLTTDPEWQEHPMLILGDGTNCLFRQDFQGLVLRIENRGIQIIEESSEDVLVRIAAGENWSKLVIWCAGRLFWGVENLANIPGSAGAAPIQNIGAYGCELAQVLESVTAWDQQKESWTTLTREDCGFGYRSSRFKNEDAGRFVITEIALRLAKHGQPVVDYPGVSEALGPVDLADATPEDLVRAITAIRSRKLPDPRQLGNAGSFFKNPLVDADTADSLGREWPEMPRYPQTDGRSKLSAGWLIDQCQWKGRRMGDAGVYFAHALVLVNHGQASGQELWQLAKQIQADVHKKFGLNLEPEPTII